MDPISSTNKGTQSSPQKNGLSVGHGAFKKKKSLTKPRSRAGCVTCKQKHLKCDEAKPFCQTCQKKGLQCGGYKQQIRWSYKHEAPIQSGYNELTWNSEPSHQDDSSSQPNLLSPSQSIPGGDSLPDADWQSALAILQSLGDDASGNDEVTVPHEFGTSSVAPPIMDFNGMDLGDINSGSASTQAIALPETEFEGEITEPLEGIVPETDLEWISTEQNPIEFSTVVISPSLVHTPSVLITHWFERVCGVWSGYDSHLNFNRSLAMNLWQNSESVSNCLQSMSAALMSSKSPEMKQTSLRLLNDATSAVHREMSLVHSSQRLNTIPIALLFSLLCLGTSVCWTEATYLGVPFLREARALVDRVNPHALNLTAEDKQILSFFDRSLVYCDMMLAMVGYGKVPEKGVEDENEDTSSLHPWTGISTASYRLFARAVILCQNFCRSSRRPRTTAQQLQAALRQIEEAQSIEEQVLSMVTPVEENLGETGDQRTPSSHLVSLAEAYRLASLVHLYQTFPDLAARRLPRDSSDTENSQASADSWIVALSVRLIETLKEIPPHSGTRMMQPALYISASTGLKLNMPSADLSQETTWQTSGTSSREVETAPTHEDCGMSEYMSHLCDLGTQNENTSDSVPILTALEVKAARTFVLERLEIFENTLPPKPIIMTRDLVKAIWAAYDADTSGGFPVHWVDVMESKNLRSLFG